MKKYTRNNN